MNSKNAKVVSSPFSAYSRGVPLAGRGQFDSGQLLESAGRQLIDISGAIVNLVLAQGWLSVFNLILTIAANSFYTYLGFSSVKADLSFTIISFVVLLSLVLWVFFTLSRRNSALSDLSLVKTLVIHLGLAHDFSLPEEQLPANHSLEVQEALTSLLDALHAYFSRQRFFCRHYPLLETRTRMIRVAQARSRSMRRILNALRRLSTAEQMLRASGLSDSQGASMSSLLLQLHVTIERMATIKEFRTPVGLRALLMVCVVLIIPLFFAPYYAFIRSEQLSFTFALFFAMVLNQAIMALYNVAVALEDPFDSQGLDSIFVDEALEEARQAVLGRHDRGSAPDADDAEEGDDGDDSPAAADGDVVMPVDGLPLPPDSRPGAQQL